MGAEVFHALKKTLHDRGLGDRGRRRGRLRARPRVQRGGAADARRGHRGRRLHAGRGRRDRAGPGDAARSSTDGVYDLEHEGRKLTLRRAGRLLGRPGRQVPDRLDRGRHGRGGLGRLEGADRRASATRVQLVGDDLFVTNPERLQRGIDARRRQLDPHQGQPDRHADRDARPRSAWRARPATPRSCRTARARPRT